MPGISPTQRTLRALRQQGCICGIVERWNQFAAPRPGGPPGIREDLFGFIDIIALYPTGICAIQSCGQAFSEHDKKILANEVAPEWLKSGGRIELWGWRKVKKIRGGKQEVWKPRIKEYFLADFNEKKEQGLSLEKLALAQNVRPMENMEILYGTWPDEEDDYD